MHLVSFLLLLTCSCLAGTNFFAVTAVNRAGLESDYSVEVNAEAKRWVSLAWDASPTNENVVKYHVHWGQAPRRYTRMVEVSTNHVLLALGSGALDLNLMASTNMVQWAVDRTILSVTNPVGNKFYRLEWKER